jgi:hypothetical protein
MDNPNLRTVLHKLNHSIIYGAVARTKKKRSLEKLADGAPSIVYEMHEKTEVEGFIQSNPISTSPIIYALGQSSNLFPDNQLYFNEANWASTKQLDSVVWEYIKFNHQDVANNWVDYLVERQLSHINCVEGPKNVVKNIHPTPLSLSDGLDSVTFDQISSYEPHFFENNVSSKIEGIRTKAVKKLEKEGYVTRFDLIPGKIHGVMLNSGLYHS